MACVDRSRLFRSDAAIQRPGGLIGSDGGCDLVERHLKHRGSLGCQGPLPNPTTVVITVNTDHLKQARVTAKPDAVALVEPHDRLGFRLAAALPLQNGEFVRHERFEAWIRECRPHL